MKSNNLSVSEMFSAGRREGKGAGTENKTVAMPQKKEKLGVRRL